MSSIAKKTRILYNKIHNKQIKDNKSVKRMQYTLRNSLKENNMIKIIKNSVSADLGCGNTGNGGLTLLEMGAKKVFFHDFDKSIKKNLTEKLYYFKNKYSLNFSDIKKTNYKNNFFDFILCQGVIHHVEDENKVLKEIYRILKKNGYFYFDVQGEGGLITDFVNQILIPRYKNDKKSKKIIDNIIFKKKNYLPFFKKYLIKEEKNLLKKYFDDDFFLTLQDRIKSPLYKRFSEKKLKMKLLKIGFKKVKRVKRRPNFKNIRRILNPLYINYKHEISRLLYGEGNITFLVKK